jgi:hypothetical protein
MLSEDFGAETTKAEYNAAFDSIINCKGDYHLLTACGACKRCAEQRFQLAVSGEVTGTTHGDIMRVLRARLREYNKTTAYSTSVTRYCEEEVSRQGHDVTQPEGLVRVAWMLEAWCAMLHMPHRPLTVTDIIGLGAFVERDVNRQGFRTCGVRVGPNIVPGASSTLYERVEQLLSRAHLLPPLDFYRAFENIHPFQDGNGRVGKILLNWRAGALLTPFFPPNDFWGGQEIRNP